MKNPKLIAGIVTAVLLALGINLEKFGINLEALLGGESVSLSSSQNSTSTTQTSSKDLKLNVNFDKADSNKNTSSNTSKQTYSHGPQWSKTKPAVNLWHVFEGEINRKGKPVGFHSRPGGNDPEKARVARVKDKPNRHGVYTATIEVRDGQQWKEKFSSFFPDTMSQAQVVDAIVSAYNKSNDKKRQPWRGPSGLGFDIQGYTLSRGDINTAFPVYRKD